MQVLPAVHDLAIERTASGGCRNIDLISPAIKYSQWWPNHESARRDSGRSAP